MHTSQVGLNEAFFFGILCVRMYVFLPRKEIIHVKTKYTGQRGSLLLQHLVKMAKNCAAFRKKAPLPLFRRLSADLCSSILFHGEISVKEAIHYKFHGLFYIFSTGLRNSC